MSITTGTCESRSVFRSTDMFGECQCHQCWARDVARRVVTVMVERYRVKIKTISRWFDRFRTPLNRVVRLLAAPAITQITRARRVGNALHAMRWKRRRFVQKLVAT